jgi:hypothetical protein
MTTPRPTPYDLSIAPWADDEFLPVRQALGDLGVDPWDRDAFLMAKPVVELVRKVRPEEGLGDGMDEFVALLHAAFLYWMHGEPLRPLAEDDLEALLGPAGPAASPAGGPSIAYVQFPALRIWGDAAEAASHEPFDGCFVIHRGGRLAVVGILGAHPGRDGFTVVAAEGPRPAALARPDGAPLFSPVMEGGAAAGLRSLTGMEELLELGWRLLGAGGR